MEALLIDGILPDLPAIEKDCWERLVKGAIQNDHAFHNPVVANGNAYGISMRTVVLRKVNQTEKKLFFYTDTRSGKWSELAQQDNISWLFYDANARIQVRAGGLAILHNKDELADIEWANCNMSNRKNYLGYLIPSSATAGPTSGLHPEFEYTDPTKEQSERGRQHFGVVVTSVKWMDWLWLNYHGHRRASFVYDETGNFASTWRVP